MKPRSSTSILRQQIKSDRVLTCRSNKRYTSTNALCTSIKAIGKRTINRWMGRAIIVDESYVIIAKTRRNLCTVGIINAEVQHIILLPCFGLYTPICVANIHPCQMINEQLGVVIGKVIVNVKTLRRCSVVIAPWIKGTGKWDRDQGFSKCRRSKLQLQCIEL